MVTIINNITLTRIGWQANGPCARGHRYAVVQSQQRQIVLEVQVTEFAHDGS